MSQMLAIKVMVGSNFGVRRKRGCFFREKRAFMLLMVYIFTVCNGDKRQSGDYFFIVACIIVDK
jgi:hypothetical protein